MVSQEQATQTEQLKNQYRQYFGLTSKTILKFISSLILPLMLGVFTVVITFHQQKVAREQRIEDMQLVRQQRLEDKNELQLQHQLEWDIAIKNQEVQSKAASDRYRDEVLVAYIKEIGDFLKENNGSLTSDSLLHTLARVKTLNAIGQLDGSRQIRILRFLYETAQLTNTNKFGALDISTAELIDIDFRTFTPSKEITQLSLAGVYLRNFTFEKISLYHVDFSSAWLENVNFSSARVNNVNFSPAKLINVKFSSAELADVKFSSTHLDHVNFSYAHPVNVNFSYAHPVNVNFSSAGLDNVDFSFARLKNVNFSSAELCNVSFSSAWLTTLNYSSAGLTNVNFSSAWLTTVNFSSATFSNID